MPEEPTRGATSQDMGFIKEGTTPKKERAITRAAGSPETEKSESDESSDEPEIQPYQGGHRVKQWIKHTKMQFPEVLEEHYKVVSASNKEIEDIIIPYEYKRKDTKHSS